MQRQFEHAVLPSASHDERARENFSRSLKRSVVGKLVPATVSVWQTRVRDRLPAEPKHRSEVRHAMLEDQFIQVSYSLRRILQEQIWDNASEIVERQIEDLNERAAQAGQTAGGSVSTDPDLPIPRYLQAVDIHAMPTGYWDVATDGYDVAAGAIYDRGLFVYGLGTGGPLNDGRARSIIDNFFRAQLPDFKPRRILDLGCGFGGALLPYVDAFPDAEVYGVDIGAGLVRYGHARAESLGKRVHFSQQNAEHTTFPDCHFDLVMSHILLHETSRPALARIIAESYRLVAPGGLVMHAEVPQYEDLDVFSQFLMDYDTHYNNEPFWGAMHDTDLHALAVAAGFAPEDVRDVLVPSGRNEAGERLGQKEGSASAGMLQLTVATKPAAG